MPEIARVASHWGHSKAGCLGWNVIAAFPPHPPESFRLADAWEMHSTGGWLWLITHRWFKNLL